MQKQTILIVDDEPNVVDTLVVFFARKGYETFKANSAEAALGILESFKIDLIFLDLLLPGMMDGSEAARIIKKKYPCTKIIVVTGFPEESKKLDYEGILDGIFIKPVGVNELYTKLIDVLAHREISILDAKQQQGIKARVLVIKAKILFLEPSFEIAKILRDYLKRLSSQGEYYEIEVARTQEELEAQLASFRPELLFINTACFPAEGKDFLNAATKPPNEIFRYDLVSLGEKGEPVLEHFSGIIQRACLKKGLIDLQWKEI